MKKLKNKIAVIDFETDPFLYDRVPYPFVAGLYDGENYYQFWGKDCAFRLADCINTDYSDYTIYAHNGGKFDFFFLLEYVKPELMIINGRIAECAIGGAKMRDSYLVLPLPLSAYKKDEVDYSIFEESERDKPRNKEAITIYLRNDCRYLYDWIKKFLDRFGNKLTLASAAFDQLKKTGYNIGRTRKAYDQAFRKFYYGGRVQTFKTGSFKGNFTYYDINSAYPYAMLHKHPWSSSYYETFSIPKDKTFFSEILAVSKGALPYRLASGELTFPNDDEIRKYLVTGWEINAGIETGSLDIKKVIKTYIPDISISFTDYVNKFYSEKLESKLKGDKDNETFAKLMLNSAYGKFGLDPEKFKEYRIVPIGEYPEDGEDWELVSDTETGQSIFERPDPGDKFYNVATAASITGFVRAYLWRSICQAKGVLYCDTDSLICESFNGVIGNDLGQWKVEAELSEAHIAAKKIYACCIRGTDEWKKASKGCRLEVKDIKELCKGKQITWQKDAPAFSLKYGARFIERKISAKTLESFEED